MSDTKCWSAGVVAPVLALALGVTIFGAATPALAQGAAQVDEARLVGADAEPGQWMSHGRTYGEQRFSPLDQITTDNVGDLGLSWFADFDTNRGQEATPIVVDGAIYVSTAWSKVYAYDARTGEQLWFYDPEVDGQRGVYACCDVVNRGVAVWNGKVYVGTFDGRLVAIDAATGQEIWDVNTVDLDWPYSITGAPRVVKGKVIIGNGGAELGVRGYVTAYDAETGEQEWRFYTVPGNPADGFENAAMEMAAATWAGEWWTLGGGGTVWDSMAYDPDLDLLYIGVGNGSPWNRRLRSNGEGDNLFLTSIVALDPDTGDYVWHYQTSPGESWDHTATQQITVADLEIEGATRRVVMQAPKNGFFYILDAGTGELLSAEPITELSWATHVDMATGRPVETPEARYEETGQPFTSRQNPNGVHTWHSMSYSPETGLVYIPIHQANSNFGDDLNFVPRAMANNTGTALGGGPAPADPEEAARRAAEALASTQGRLIAWDPIESREAWRLERDGPLNGGALSTAGGLVFQGTGSGRFTAIDAASGAELWSAETQTAVLAAPVSYELDGVQHVAIVVGTGGSWGQVGGAGNMKGVVRENRSRILVYRLGGTAALPPAVDRPLPPLNPPPATADAETVALGAQQYGIYCGRCHGGGANQLGILPDLRYSASLGDEALFAGVVHDGLLAANGMANFSAVLGPAEVEAVRAYLIDRANALAAETGAQ